MLTSVAVLQHRVFSFRSIQPRRESFGSTRERGAQRLVFVPWMFDRPQCQDGCQSINKVSFDVPSYKHNHEDSFVGGRISAVSLVAVARDWRDSAERRLATSSRDRESGGGDSFSLNYGELQCHSPKALLWLK